MDRTCGGQRFVRSSLINQIWPETLNPAATELESFFTVRETRYLSETVGSNKLAELDLYLRRFAAADAGFGGVGQ